MRPIHHRLEQRVKAHIFVCLLAYYVQWHLKRAWSRLLFADEHLDQHRADRDPVASAKPTADVQAKKIERRTEDGNELQSFRTLLNELATQCQNTCEFGEGTTVTPIVKLAEPTPFQTEAVRLLESYCRMGSSYDLPKTGATHPRVQLVTGGVSDVDMSRLNDALDTCDFLLQHIASDGRYDVEELWGPESDLYMYGTISVLVEAYRITGEQKYFEGTRKCLDHFKASQLPSGGWTLKLAGNGREFKMSEDERRHSFECESIPITGAIAFAVGKYRQATGDDRYDDMINSAIDHALEYWSEESESFVEDSQEHYTGLRSVSAGYQAHFLLGFHTWQDYRPELRPTVTRLTETIRRNFESFDESTMLFMRVLHAVLLMRSSPKEYVVNVIKPRLDEIVQSRVFKCDKIRGGYGHRDGSRGIVKTEANCRGTTSVAIAMKRYDLTTKTSTYRESREYHDAAAWIDSMKDEHGYFEYQQESDMKPLGKGSPGQFLPCWWIFGTL